MASSAGSLNRVSLIGFQAKDAEKHVGEKGSAVTISLVTHNAWKDKDGNRQEKADFHRVVFFGMFGERVHRHLAKGKRLFVEGELRNESYTSKEGEKRYSYSITARDIIFLDRKGKSSTHVSDSENGGVAEDAAEDAEVSEAEVETEAAKAA